MRAPIAAQQKRAHSRNDRSGMGRKERGKWCACDCAASGRAGEGWSIICTAAFGCAAERALVTSQLGGACRCGVAGRTMVGTQRRDRASRGQSWCCCKFLSFRVLAQVPGGRCRPDRASYSGEPGADALKRAPASSPSGHGHGSTLKFKVAAAATLSTNFVKQK